MGLSDILFSYIQTKENKLKGDANLWNNYSILGRIIFEILCTIERPYLEKNFTFDELVNSFHNSTYRQYVYSLKFSRRVTNDEISGLERTIFRDMAKYYKVDISEFKKWYKIVLVNDTLFVESLK